MLAVRAFTYTGPATMAGVALRNVPFVAIENTATPGPGGIIEVFHPETGEACFNRNVWEHCLKLREGPCSRSQ